MILKDHIELLSHRSPTGEFAVFWPSIAKHLPTSTRRTRHNKNIIMARISQSSQPSPPPRKRKSDGDADAEPQRKRKQKFSHLAPKTKHISQELIRAEWKSLPKPAQQVVRDIFLAAKRTTLTQIHDGPRRREADFVVNDVLKRLERQLPRMPFPPGTKAAGLELDGVLETVVGPLLPRFEAAWNTVC